jgi:hypothetical protein
MPGRLFRTAPLVAVVSALVAGLAAGCGGSGDDLKPAAAPPPSAKASQFPAGKGQTIDQLREGLPQGPVLAPTVSIVDPGADGRVGFAIFDRARKQITGASVALYTAGPDGSKVRGPYPARTESLAVKPQFVARTTSQDPDAARSIYVANVPFKGKGPQALIALARLDGRLVASSPAPVQVRPKSEPPRVGEKAISVSTPTRDSVGGDLAKIDTRVPPDTQHDVDLANVIGRKPVVLTFATPQLCQSRVCGPVVDITEQLKSQYGDKADFIHMEIYKDNKIANPPQFRPQVTAWRLPTEPWTFVIGKDGKVKARFEGAYSVGELQRAVAPVVKSS